MSKDYENEIYCSAPWRGLTVREDGKVRTCCVGRSILGDLNHSSLEDILDRSPKLQDIKSTLMSGKPHPNCQACIDQEKTNNFAQLRHLYQTQYPLDSTEHRLKFLDIRWNNKCNLACQYCNPTFSSIWEDRLNIPVKSAKKSYHDDLLAWVLDRSHEIDELLLVGGEPMLMKQNYQLFQKLPLDAKVSIITNLSYDLESLPCWNNLLSRPKEKILWNVSSENVGQQYEYVRNGSSWDVFNRNLQTLVKHWPDTVSIQMVFSMFSALDLYDIITYYHSIGIKKITLQPIMEQEEMSVFNMPKPIRDHVVKVIDDILDWHQKTFGIDADLYPISGLLPIRQGLIDAQNEKHMSADRFYTKISSYDSWSQIKFKDLWPRTTALLDQHLVSV